jgi:hypothetical protein
MKQTAVEFVEELIKVILYYLDDDELQRIQKVIDEAKEIENEQKGYTQEEVIQIISNYHQLKLNEFKNLLDLLEFKKK